MSASGVGFLLFSLGLYSRCKTNRSTSGESRAKIVSYEFPCWSRFNMRHEGTNHCLLKPVTFLFSAWSRKFSWPNKEAIAEVKSTHEDVEIHTRISIHALHVASRLNWVTSDATSTHIKTSCVNQTKGFIANTKLRTQNLGRTYGWKRS